MSLFVDFAGLNTLIQDAITSSANYIGYPLTADVSSYYNPEFSLANNIDYLAALNAHRNGPYGHPIFKQIRTSQNPLTRYQVANNKYSIVEQPSQQVNIGVSSNTNYKVDYVSSRYGNVIQFDEMCLTSKHKPLLYVFGIGIDNPRIENKPILSSPNIEKVIIKDSFGNEIDFFGNLSLNSRLGLSSLVDDDYERIKQFYLDGGLDSDDSPVTTFEMIKYGEKVWPRDIYTYRNYTRQRPNYLNNFWRDSRIDRNVDSANGFGNDVEDSMWHIDAASDFVSKTSVEVGYNPSQRDDAGILQNNYSLYTLTAGPPAGTWDNNIKPAPYYTRLHGIGTSDSVVAPSGIDIPETSSGVGDIFQGTALWEAASQSGKNPFYSSYDKYIKDIRAKYKDYSIIPEYRSSLFAERFYISGSNININNMLEITGGLSGTSDSSQDNFYEIYSTSDFLTHFAKIKKDHEGFVDPSMIKLTCKAVKKFIAYDSFYPQQRTVDIAKRFWNSYSDYVSSSVVISSSRGPGTQVEFSKQNLLVPLFAPGVLYNSIKAGVACDYPLITGSLEVTSSTAGDFYIMTDEFPVRVPFDALLKPQGYLSDVELISNEPHPSGNFEATCFWNGGGDSLYNSMVSNFCAEVADFFLANKSFTTLQSLPQSDPNFGQLVSGSKYAMRLRMYRSMDSYNNAYSSSANGWWVPPQDVGPNYAKETITMYSRPSAFGPACGASQATNDVNRACSRDGFNFPFTPPYYHGQAWVDIVYEPTRSGKHSIDEIIEGAEYTYSRIDAASWIAEHNDSSFGPQQASKINLNAMQISASLTVKGIAAKSGIGAGRPVLNSNDTAGNAAWTIQPFFETPILNFKDVDVTLPENIDCGQTPRGMWHQYGRLPEGDEGIYFDVTDLPPTWIENKLQEDSKNYESLANAVGFDKSPIRLGNISDRKIISEAVVAVPFIDVQGTKKFFEFSRDMINSVVGNYALNAGRDPDGKYGSSLKNMVRKMKKYNFPPKFDFLRNESIRPFAMYIFEFYHVLNEQDLADIWQGLPPTIGESHEEAAASISHPLLAKELLGPTIYGNNNRTGAFLPEKIKWMVFKVKRRAKKNYYEKVLSSNISDVQAFNDSSQGYNWPYDFFSLVELAKIDTEITFSDIILKGSSISNRPKGNENFEKSTRTESLLSATNNPNNVAGIVSDNPPPTYGDDTPGTDQPPAPDVPPVDAGKGGTGGDGTGGSGPGGTFTPKDRINQWLEEQDEDNFDDPQVQT